MSMINSIFVFGCQFIEVQPLMFLKVYASFILHLNSDSFCLPFLFGPYGPWLWAFISFQPPGFNLDRLSFHYYPPVLQAIEYFVKTMYHCLLGSFCNKFEHICPIPSAIVALPRHQLFLSTYLFFFFLLYMIVL